MTQKLGKSALTTAAVVASMTLTGGVMQAHAADNVLGSDTTAKKATSAEQQTASSVSQASQDLQNANANLQATQNANSAVHNALNQAQDNLNAKAQNYQTAQNAANDSTQENIDNQTAKVAHDNNDVAQAQQNLQETQNQLSQATNTANQAQQAFDTADVAAKAQSDNVKKLTDQVKNDEIATDKASVVKKVDQAKVNVDQDEKSVASATQADDNAKSNQSKAIQNQQAAGKALSSAKVNESSAKQKADTAAKNVEQQAQTVKDKQKNVDNLNQSLGKLTTHSDVDAAQQTVDTDKLDVQKAQSAKDTALANQQGAQETLDKAETDATHTAAAQKTADATYQAAVNSTNDANAKLKEAENGNSLPTMVFSQDEIKTTQEFVKLLKEFLDKGDHDTLSSTDVYDNDDSNIKATYKNWVNAMTYAPYMAGGTISLGTEFHKYDSNWKDTSTADQNELVDLLNMTQAEKEEVTFFTSAILNNIRKQLGIDNEVGLARISTGSIDMADEISKIAIKNKWKYLGHYGYAVTKAAYDHGVYGGTEPTDPTSRSSYQSYESAGFIPIGFEYGYTKVTMAEFKEQIVDTIDLMLHTDNDQHMGHAAALLGFYNMEKGLDNINSIYDYVGVSMNPGYYEDSYSGYGYLHIINVPEYYIDPQIPAYKWVIGTNNTDAVTRRAATKMTEQLTNPYENDYVNTLRQNAATALASQNAAKAALDNAISQNNAAQKALTEAKSKNDVAKMALSNAEQSLSQSQSRLVKDTATLNQVMAQYQADMQREASRVKALDQAKQDLRAAQDSLAELQAVAQNAQNNLSAAQNATQKAQNDFDNADKASKSANNLLAETTASLNTAKQKLSTDTEALTAAQLDLQEFDANLPANLKKLAKDRSALTAAKDLLSKLQSAADSAKQNLGTAKSALSSAQNAVTAAEQKLATAEKQLNDDQTKLDTLIQALADLKQAKKELDAAQAALTNAEKAAAESDQALLDAKANQAAMQKVYDAVMAKVQAIQAKNALLNSVKEQQAKLRAAAGSNMESMHESLANVSSTVANTTAAGLVAKNAAKSGSLPQTGNTSEHTASLLGLGLLGMFAGLFGLRKKQKD